MIELKNAGKKFNNTWLFRNLNLTIQPGDFVSIIGPSGCGKSTLLRILACLDTLSEGQLSHTSVSSTGFVFQDSCLLPWLTAAENVAIGFQNSGLTADDMKSQVLKMLSVVKLEKRSNDFPHQLSGGMKMRVSIARALINNKSLLLMDEPFAALDDFIRFELQEELLEYWKSHKMTVLFVTHSLMESIFLSQKLWLFPQGSLLNFTETSLAKSIMLPQEYRKSDHYFKTVNLISEQLRGPE